LAILRNWESGHGRIRLLHNPRRYVSYALNDAIKMTKGEIIVRLDAHTEYADDYFETILAAFQKTGADIVGGPMRTTYDNPTQEAVAYAICTPFAIGNSSFHNLDFEGYTDSVTYGSWKRNIFDVTGLFDEKLKRNQDDEFHYRARSFGFKIYQSPDIKLFYYPRNTLRTLYKQYFQYGLYKPMVLKKVKSGFQWRHLVPSLFVLYLFTLFLGIAYPFWLLPLALYLFVNALFMLRSHKTIAVMFRLFFVYMTIHVGYGLGFLSGLRKII
jgi:succinoglycan biosynthesis protein ExoA